jgi:GT2 family glycosyltransferase
MNALGVVVIGRNEGDRLGRCLRSLAGYGLPLVYVDSGSTDGSVDLARRAGAAVVELDPSIPFSAARARNEGFARSLSIAHGLELVQFLDGDCEVVPGWLERGVREMRSDGRLGAVCGRVRELERDRSIYNRLCDMEWDGPPGEAAACGGNAMMRVRAFSEVGGFDSALIAGEEPELSLRLRRRGWRILRVDADMVRHDAAMTRFAQWWRRTLRGGLAFAHGAALHGSAPERHWARQRRSILWWGAALPAAVLLSAWPTGGLSLLLLAAYPALAARIYARSVRSGLSPRDAGLRAAFLVLGKFPEALGMARFAATRGRERRALDWR